MVIKKYYENLTTWLIKHAINRWYPVPRLVWHYVTTWLINYKHAINRWNPVPCLVWHYVTTCICIDNIFLEQIEPVLALPWNSMLVLVILIYSLRVYWGFFVLCFVVTKMWFTSMFLSFHIMEILNIIQMGLIQECNCIMGKCLYKSCDWLVWILWGCWACSL